MTWQSLTEPRSSVSNSSLKPSSRLLGGTTVDERSAQENSFRPGAPDYVQDLGRSPWAQKPEPLPGLTRWLIIGAIVAGGVLIGLLAASMALSASLNLPAAGSFPLLG